VKVLFATVTGYGHVNPLLPLADALVRNGADVRWATGADMREVLASAGHRHVPAGLTAAEQRTALAAVRPPNLSPADTLAFAFRVLFPLLHASRMLPDLLRIVDDVRPDLLVCDSAELSTPLVGTLRGVPWTQHSYGIIRPDYAWQLATAALAPLWAQHGLDVVSRAGMFDGTYLDICPPALQSADISSVPDRCALRPPRAPEAMPPMRRRQDAPHVLVSFGTVFNRRLGALVDQLAPLPLELTVTTGPGSDDGSFDDVPQNVHVVDYVPLSEVLPSCSAVVTHGGSGTMLAALAHGVPLVVVPQGADNLYNGERVQAVGAGLCVGAGGYVPAALNAVLRDPSFTATARAVAAEIQQLPDADDVAAQLLAGYARR
jgi:UDP:flavonoid glycosyltransferase YjiC (YdhE family)